MEILDEKNETFFESLIQCAAAVQLTKKSIRQPDISKKLPQKFLESF